MIFEYQLCLSFQKVQHKRLSNQTAECGTLAAAFFVLVGEESFLFKSLSAKYAYIFN